MQPRIPLLILHFKIGAHVGEQRPQDWGLHQMRNCAPPVHAATRGSHAPIPQTAESVHQLGHTALGLKYHWKRILRFRTVGTQGHHPIHFVDSNRHIKRRLARERRGVKLCPPLQKEPQHRRREVALDGTMQGCTAAKRLACKRAIRSTNKFIDTLLVAVSACLVEFRPHPGFLCLFWSLHQVESVSTTSFLHRAQANTTKRI